MDYERKYKLALERAQTMQENSNGMILKKWLWGVFPELQENDDERIRKTLIEHIKGIKSWNYFLGISKEQMIAWLEKQGKKPTDKVEPKTIDANKVINWVNPDKVIEWLKNTIREVEERLGEHGIYYNTQLVLPYNSIEDLINDFKEDFGL